MESKAISIIRNYKTGNRETARNEIKELLEQGMDPNKYSPEGVNVFQYAYISDAFTVIEEMIPYLDRTKGPPYYDLYCTPLLINAYIYKDHRFFSDILFSRPSIIFEKLYETASKQELKNFKTFEENLKDSFIVDYKEKYTNEFSRTNGYIYGNIQNELNTHRLIPKEFRVCVKVNMFVWKFAIKLLILHSKTMKKTYAPNGAGYIRTLEHFNSIKLN